MGYQSKITLREAVAAGYATWDLFISNWGGANSGNQQDLIFPEPITQADTVIPNLFGIRIGPYSTTDQVYVTFALPNSLTQTMPLSINQPILYPLQGPMIISPGGPTTPSAVIAGINTMTSSRAYKEVGLLGGAVITLLTVANFPQLKDTTLHLQFLLRDDLDWSGHHARAPYRDTKTAVGVTSTEQIAVIWPTWGRRRAAISYTIDGTSAATVRTTGFVECISSSRLVEVELSGAVDTITPSGSFGALRHCLDIMSVDFVCARIAKVGGGTVNMGCSIWAEDE